MINKVFLDLDDVLNDFTLTALQFVGCPVAARSFAAYDERWGFDIIQAVNALHPTKTWRLKEFWNSIPRSVWANLPKSEEFDQVLDFAINLVGRSNVCILTSPTLDPSCAAGKVEWIQRNMPADMNRQYFIGPRKWFCAAPESLLIDDCECNTQLFKNHGGQAILFPRPWNSKHNVNYRDNLTKEFNVFSRK